jgi:hypothetical protein
LKHVREKQQLKSKQFAASYSFSETPIIISTKNKHVYI